ncbi:arylsulfatase [uncultured Thiodictyon sp.]|uniref:arylsulfatase n=1 Tax=uncultured Thiodictyon sp. TaxID=1846217 RepID=UPI0025D5910A|nr:arylsulfatase [uncultured Thiodictyon sp.]
MKRSLLGLLAAAALLIHLPGLAATAAAQNAPAATPAAAAAAKPNILVVFGDDVGIQNVSAYANGVVGYRTPNIDRIAKEGAIFTDYYGQQSCTAGRSALITGQNPFRTGLSKVGLPGAPQGLQKEDPTIAELLKPLGYATGQFGKNHLGDRDEFLPTVHGFDEFFGNLYHLNAEEEPENEDYPKNPAFREKFGPRGVLHSWANPDGTQRIEDTGPLTKKRMETVDTEVLDAAEGFMTRAQQAGTPFFVWFNTTRMHNFTHVMAEHRTSGLGEYADGMIEHDAQIGRLLDYLDKSGLADHTILLYTSDNGPMVCLWPDAGATPFRGEKNTNWEGGWRVPAMIRWPGAVKPGTVVNDIVAGEDWLPTLLAAAGAPGVKDTLLTGYQAGAKTFKVHLDGYDQTPLLTGKGPGARHEFFYFSDDGDLLAVRYEHLKMHFMVQNATGMDVWRRPFETLRAPLFFDLRSDPGERGQEGMGYNDWWYRHSFYAIPSQRIVGSFLASFKEFPPRQKPGSFTVENALEALSQPASGSR